MRCIDLSLAITDFSPDFQRYQQEDAHEFLQAFLEKLERCGSDRRSFHGNISSQDVFAGRLISGVSSLLEILYLVKCQRYFGMSFILISVNMYVFLLSAPLLQLQLCLRDI